MRTVIRNSKDVKGEVAQLWLDRENYVAQMRERFPTVAVLKAVAAAHGFTVADLRHRDRSHALSLARHHAFWELRRRRIDLGYQQIAAELNRGDHTTAVYGYKRFCKLADAGEYATERAAVAKTLGDRA